MLWEWGRRTSNHLFYELENSFEQYRNLCLKLELNLNWSFWEISEIWLMFFNLVNLNFHISAHFKLRIETGRSRNPLRDNVLIKFSTWLYRLKQFDCCFNFILKKVLSLKALLQTVFSYVICNIFFDLSCHPHSLIPFLFEYFAFCFL